MKICILYGGTSSERDISISTGKSIYDAISDEYEITMCDFDENYDALLENIQNVDLVFNALHGGSGENGAVQKYLESKCVKFTGSNSLASKKAMNKEVSKLLCVENDIPTPSWFVLSALSSTIDNAFLSRDEMLAKINSFCKIDSENKSIVVKPNNEGSSVGISILKGITTDCQYSEALDNAFKVSDKILVEEYIGGRELTVSILDGKVMPIVEIIPKNEYYDYKSKYTKYQSEYVVPAKISKEVEDLLSTYSLKIHKLIGCGAYSRVDFRLSENNKPYFLELNTLPGFTDTSLFPKSAAKEGLEYKNLIKKIIEIS